MRLSWIELVGFRSYEALQWEPESGVNVLVGRNAVGKTNLLEGIGYLATLRSFRRTPDSALIRTGDPRAVVRGEVVAVNGSSLIEVELPTAGRRRAQVNRERLGRLRDLMGKVRMVVFMPDDLELVKRGPSRRRDLLDAISVQIWPTAYADQREYERALRQRNMLLKQMGYRTDPVSLEVWDERVSLAGGRVMVRRKAAISAVEALAGKYYRSFTECDTTVRIDYRSGWGAEGEEGLEGWVSALREALLASRSSDLERRQTTVGPHRDDVVLLLDDRDSRVQASQGEQRALTLALRLSVHRAVLESTGEPPLLLLDDVFSELDPDRARRLARSLPAAQTFITTAREEDVPIEGRAWRIVDGVWK